MPPSSATRTLCRQEPDACVMKLPAKPTSYLPPLACLAPEGSSACQVLPTTAAAGARRRSSLHCSRRQRCRCLRSFIAFMQLAARVHLST